MLHRHQMLLGFSHFFILLVKLSSTLNAPERGCTERECGVKQATLSQTVSRLISSNRGPASQGWVGSKGIHSK